MSLSKWNLCFNFLGKIIPAALSLVATPIYLKLLGVELYGLIGVFAVVSNFLILFDLGLSSALVREMARLSVISQEPQEFRNLTRTLEVIFWTTAILIGVVIVFLSDFIAERWVHAQTLSPLVVRDSIRLMGLAFVFLWPSLVYQNGLLGLQKQVTSNVILIIFGVLRSLGVIPMLIWIDPTIYTFFIWQIIINLLQLPVFMSCFWRVLPKSALKPKFEFLQLKKIWGYASGITALTLITLPLTNLDKIILSNRLDLKLFGYYVLAANLAMNLYMLISPIFTTYFPKLTKAVAAENWEELKQVYHSSCQIMSVLLLPAALMLVFFIKEVLFILTRDPLVVEQTAPIARLLILGTACNGLMNIPFGLQLAHGWLKYVIWQNVISLVLLVPLTFVNAELYGSVGVAATWLIHNAACVVLMIPLIHSKFLKEEKRAWYMNDVCLPLICTLSMVLLWRWVFPLHLGSLPTLLFLFIGLLLACIAAGMSTPLVRSYIVKGAALRLRKRNV